MRQMMARSHASYHTLCSANALPHGEKTGDNGVSERVCFVAPSMLEKQVPQTPQLHFTRLRSVRIDVRHAEDDRDTRSCAVAPERDIVQHCFGPRVVKLDALRACQATAVSEAETKGQCMCKVSCHKTMRQ